jgi:hypothetical protein
MLTDAGVAAVEGGLDMAMPNGSTYWGAGGNNLVRMVQNGSVEETRITDSKSNEFIYSRSYTDIYDSGNSYRFYLVSNGARREKSSINSTTFTN